MRGEDTEKNEKNRSRGRIASDTVEEKKQKRRRKERQDEYKGEVRREMI